MEIQEIRECMPQFQESLFLGIQREVRGIPVLAAGIFRKEEELFLYLFAEEKDRSEEQKRYARLERKRRRGTLTKREEMLAEVEKRDANLLDLVEGIRVNGKEYRYCSGTGGGLEEYNLEGRMMLYYLISNQVEFGFLEQQDLNLIQYAEMKLKGDYKGIPFSRSDLETLELITQPPHYHIPVKRKMKMSLGQQKGRKQKFFCEELGREIFYYINEITLTDTWSECREKYEAAAKERPEVSEEDMKPLFEHVQKICPPGMGNLVVEYECQEATLEFYTKEQLQDKVEITHGAAAFFLVGSRTKKIGMHGQRLKACLIQYPVDPTVQEVELELLRAMVQEE
ncbi:MAG: hypothetical protein HFH41_00505 [Lachnospiraceae bacterium]|nr:hypothetical protein [Lachnospiraceae bacterium]